MKIFKCEDIENNNGVVQIRVYLISITFFKVPKEDYCSLLEKFN
jgi:hypothetical protein